MGLWKPTFTMVWFVVICVSFAGGLVYLVVSGCFADFVNLVRYL